MTDQIAKSVHTPGPWALEESDGTIRARCWGESDQMGDYLGVIVCDLKPALGAWPCVGRAHAEPETRANAALIAAAPDLLAACEAAEGIMRAYIPADLFDGHAAAALVQVRDAILKSRGK